jgi:hypothetical protein
LQTPIGDDTNFQILAQGGDNTRNLSLAGRGGGPLKVEYNFRSASGRLI